MLMVCEKEDEAEAGTQDEEKKMIRRAQLS